MDNAFVCEINSIAPPGYNLLTLILNDNQQNRIIISLPHYQNSFTYGCHNIAFQLLSRALNILKFGLLSRSNIENVLSNASKASRHMITVRINGQRRDIIFCRWLKFWLSICEMHLID